MNVRLKMDKAQFIVLYKWLKWKENLMSSDVTPEQNQSINSFLESNKSVFDKTNDVSVFGKKQWKVGDVVKIVKRNIYHDNNSEYVVVQIHGSSKLGLLPIDHITSERMIQQYKTAVPWRWFNCENIGFARELTQAEKEVFSRWKLSKSRRKNVNESYVQNNSLF